MTREEAIKILSSESYIGNSKLDDAIEYAIKVLSALKKADMTREERENVLHCLKVINDEEVCEECNLYGTTETDHCQYDCVRLAIEALSEPTTITENMTNGDVIKAVIPDA